jgi:hypothetical protein
MLSKVSLLALLGVLVVAQDLSPPCIRNCYDNNPGPSSCDVPDGGPAVDNEGLARCTCSTFSIDRSDPLYKCLLKCPVDQQTKYLQGWTTTTYGCAQLFPDVDEEEVDAGRSDPSDQSDGGGSGNTDDDNSDESADEQPSTSAADNAKSTDHADEEDAASLASGASILGVLAAGGATLVLNL